MKKLHLFLLLIICTISSNLLAQVYPFRVNTFVKQPALADWSYYVDDIERPITINVIFNDLKEPSWDYRLRLTLTNINTGQK